MERDVASYEAEVLQLRTALESRAVIDQAKGILIARFALTPDGAYALLSRWSQDTNVKVRILAQHLVSANSAQGLGTDLAEVIRQVGRDALPPDPRRS